MTEEVKQFAEDLAAVRQDLVRQGWRVLAMCEEVFEAFFAGDTAKGQEAIDKDDEVDRIDIEIEQRTVDLLSAAARVASEVPMTEIRDALVIVKVNNELERIADLGVDIAEQVESRIGVDVPETFRVIANSVLGILRDTCSALERKDADLAKVILRSENTVREFKQNMLRDAENDIASGSMSVDCGFLLHDIASKCEMISDHATNIAEQLLYALTGTIVRHTSEGWVEVDPRKIMRDNA